MKKTLLSKNALHSLFWCFALSMLLPGKSWGQALLVDDFTGTTGSTLTTNGWTAHPSAGTNPITIATPSISYLGYGSSNIGNEVTMTTGEDIHKTFTAQTSGTVYASFLVNVTSASTGGDYFFHFGQTTIGTTFRGRVFVRRDASNNVSFGISQSTTTVNYSAASYALNTTYLIVLRYEVIDGTANDVSSIYINPTLNAAIPSTGWISNTDAAGTDLANVGSVALRQGGATTAPGLKLDGIRVSTTWSDIVGAVTSTTWNGSAWSNGAPTSTVDAIITGNYSTGATAINAKSVTVNSGTLTVNASGSLTIQNELNNVGGSVIVENNANLIQVSNISNTGEITINRNGASLMLLDYSLWSSPVSGQKLKAFSPNTLDNRFYTYNPTTNIYVPVAAPATTDFASGNGYLIRVPNDHPSTPTIWSGIFRGVPNNGNISVSGLTSGTFNAVGNPYPSTISADAFITANNLTEPLYFWRKTNAATGTAYATYTMAGAVGAPGNGGITPNGTIQVGQGFIVKTTSNSVAFANTMRTANTANQILRTATTEKNRIWLNLSKGTEPVNQMMVAYMDGATSEIDNTLDGRYINDNETALTSSLKGEEFVIQAKGLPFDSSDIVPLSFKTELAGSFTIAIDKVDGLFLGNQEIVLKDLKAGTEQNLKTGSYTFTSEAGTFKNRFEIAFKNNQTLDINTPNFDENSVIVFNQNGALNVSTGKNAIKNIRVFDIRGVLIAEQKEVNANTASIKNVTASKQAVLIQITSEDNKTVTKKAIF